MLVSAEWSVMPMSTQSQSFYESNDYSGLVGIAEALQSDPDAIFCMMTSYYLYCDEAGGKDHGFIVVAGYLSTFARWEAFTQEWNQLLVAYDLPYFHMKEFAQSKGPFAKWKDNEGKRTAFLSCAAAIIRNHVERGFASIVEFSSFQRVNELYHLDRAFGVPYSLAGITCVEKVSDYLGTHHGVEYIFEDGDKGKGKLMEVMGQQGHSLPIFHPSRDKCDKRGRIIKGVIPIQAADFAAYELRKVFKDDPTESWPIYRYRKSLQELAGVPSDEQDWGRYSEADLIALCKKASVSARPKNPLRS
jgi:hypothetical protein